MAEATTYDLEVLLADGATWMGLMLAQPRGEDGTPVEGAPKTFSEVVAAYENDLALSKRLTADIQEDWSRGIGLDYDWAPGLYTRSPGYVCPAGAATDMTVPDAAAGPINYHAEYSTDLFFAQLGTAAKAGRVLRSAGGSGALTESLVLTVGEYVRGLLTADNGSGTTRLYAFSSDGGVANGRMHSWDGATWTSTAAALFGANGRGPAARVFWVTQDGVGASRIVTISGPRAISYTIPGADPMTAAAWVEAVLIGGSRGQLRQIAAARSHIYVSAEDGLFDLDELGNSPNLLSYVEGMVQPGNGYAVQYHDGAVFYSLGTTLDRVIVEQNGVLQESPGSCGPNWGTRAENPVLGWTTAMCLDQGYLVAALFNPSTRESYICYGKSRTILGIESPNPMIWYGPEVLLTSNYRVTAMSVSSLVSASRRLWVSSITDDGVTARISWVSLPVAGSPLQAIYSAGTHKFTTGAAGGSLQPYARLYALPNTWGDKPTLKILHQHAVGSRSLGAGTKLTEYDRADALPGDVSWGTGTDIEVSPAQTITPSTPVMGNELGRRIDFFSPSGGASTPTIAVLNSLRTTAWKVQPYVGVRVVEVEYGDGVIDRNNSTQYSEMMDPDTITTNLLALPAAGRTTVRDRAGKRWTVHFEQVTDRVETLAEGVYGKTVTARLEFDVIAGPL